MIDDSEDFKIFPVRHGNPTGKSNERQMLDTVEVEGFRTSIRNHIDGSSTMLRTRGGNPEFTHVEPNIPILKPILALKKNDLLFDITASTVTYPSGSNKLLASAYSCDAIFQLVNYISNKFPLAKSVQIDSQTPPRFVAPFELNTLVHMYCSYAGKINQWGNCWHGPISITGTLTLPTAQTKAVTGVIDPHVTMVDFSTVRAALSEKDGGRWDNYALLHGRSKRYGIDDEISLGENAWLYKSPAGKVWMLRYSSLTSITSTYFGGSTFGHSEEVRIECRPFNVSIHDWQPITAIPLPKYLKQTAIMDMVSHSKDGSKTIVNGMGYWYSMHPFYWLDGNASASGPIPGGMDEFFHMRRAMVILKIELSGGDVNPPVAEVTAIGDSAHAESIENSGSPDPFINYETSNYLPTLDNTQGYLGVQSDFVSHPSGADSNTLLIARYVTPNGVYKDVELTMNKSYWTSTEKKVYGFIQYLTLDGEGNIVNADRVDGYESTFLDWYKWTVNLGVGGTEYFIGRYVAAIVQTGFTAMPVEPRLHYGFQATGEIDDPIPTDYTYETSLRYDIRFTGNNVVTLRAHVSTDSPWLNNHLSEPYNVGWTGAVTTAHQREAVLNPISLMGISLHTTTDTHVIDVSGEQFNGQVKRGNKAVALNPATGAFNNDGSFV